MNKCSKCIYLVSNAPFKDYCRIYANANMSIGCIKKELKR